ncbi:FG-GAP-like repeat-containing protein [Chryseobacterium sp. BIGb0232]|uniref:FG-GAP-like repeat-containing protein n=1 Tax=Chryseobacterium sp. BIGb0232 TaxID=2940598 RepID=UPI000F475A6B|nr:FG-GAP-like repeat-containing protein [Chryseobacterium sp. BIGb0232]MCS4302422.1 putative repeat protein (TIGR01451 family) [Chryseobacterium sp. BIGb0232]ROS18365.1 VCBS repeat protein [Chryseobacterium nakagawai]
MKNLLFLFILFLGVNDLYATGEPSTYFQIYVPPNNDAVQRNVCLIVTAIYDDTEFNIIDDGADGDTDDSKTGILKAGQSYVLYIKDNGINDDARYASGGVLKWDGDYFIVKSNKLVYASQSTNSDWQHDWIPSVDKSSIGQKFIVYAPMISSSNRDINVFAYQNNTVIDFYKISTQPKTNTGFTDVNAENAVKVFSKTLNAGQDLIYGSAEGRDVMVSGETYMLIANKPVTMQYGALFGNERDGGGYVPTSNGSSSGELMYFTVPYQAAGEQEIRIVSWDNANAVNLDRYVNGNWVSVKTFSLNRLAAGDWVGRSNGNVSYPTVFRITCSAGKKVSVFEGNWFETGSPGTSDMATMVSSESGTTAGKNFLIYIAPPGNEINVTNPLTGSKYNGSFSHLYLFSKTGATVTVKDALTNGTKFSKTFTIAPEKYADCSVSLTEWKAFYNGTGTPSGSERPYLIVESNNDIAVMNSNFNDNWMCYTGSSLGHSFTQTSTVSDDTLIPTEQATVISQIKTSGEVTTPSVEVIVQEGLKVVESKLLNPNQSQTQGTVTELNDKTSVTYNNLPTLQPNSTYQVETKVVATVGANNGELVGTTLNATVETVITGKVNGETQQSTMANSVSVQTSNTSKLIFSRLDNPLFDSFTTNSWTISWIDINNDGYDDLYVTDMGLTAPNLIFMNNKTGGFTAGQALPEDGVSMSSTWADVDNDGDEDLLVLNNTRNPNKFYRNDNGTLVADNTKSFTQDVSYYHGGAFADYDNDNKADVFMCNYFPTKYNELHRNNSTGSFVKESTDAIPLEANSSLGPTWADYDQDGLMDLFVPNGIGNKNSLFHNDGNGTFSKKNNIINQEGGKSVGSCWGDIDNDGDLDLFVTNSNTTTNFLYKNLGNGNFQKVTNSIVNQGGSSHGCSFADIDNDGDLDLFVTNDKIRKFLYFNDGNGNFTENRDEAITYNFGLSFGHAWSDYDHDGDLDLAVATHSNQKNHIFVNNGNTNKWIEINLKATESNGSAIGSKIFVETGSRTQMREVNSQSGFGGQSSYTQHFGLGNATTINSITVKWASGIIQKINNVSIDQILEIVEPQQMKVKGIVYFDSNNDGVKQDTEPTVSRAAIKVVPTNAKVYSNDTGTFSFYATQNNVELQVLAENGLNSGSKLFDLTNYQASQQIYIPATSACNDTDLKINMGGTAIRKGYTNNQFRIVVSNQSRNMSASSVLNFVVPSTVSISSPSSPITQQGTFVVNAKNYTRYSWSLGALNPFNNKVISFMTGTDASVLINDELEFKGEIVNASTDCNLEDNLLIQKYNVYGAIDPNDILVYPKGYGDEGYILPDQMLTYTIRFENVGNFATQNVSIVDTMPQEVDMNTFKVVSTSHDNISTEIVDNKVTFKLENVFLPPTETDSKASQGYVTFSVLPKKGLAEETKIMNSALIAFDDERTMRTNTVTNTIQSKAIEEELTIVQLYPNPVNDVAFIRLEHRKGSEYTRKQIVKADVFDLNGIRVLEKNFSPSEEVRIDLPLEIKGYYLLRVTDSENKAYTKKMLVKLKR